MIDYMMDVSVLRDNQKEMSEQKIEEERKTETTMQEKETTQSQRPLILEATPNFDDYPYTKFEKARIIGARTEQIAHGSPIFVDPGGIIDPTEIAKLEFERGVCPIIVEKKEGDKAAKILHK